MKKIVFSLISLISLSALAFDMDVALVRNEQVIVTGKLENVQVNEPRNILMSDSACIDAVVLDKNEQGIRIRFALAAKNTEGNFEVQANPEMHVAFNEPAALKVNAENPESAFDVVFLVNNK